ncbi:unnamed protein product, partial [Heligmosomoides polygyrus]|uniref:Palmitoyltransferase n=1 Tax=Heligmosomoides polygyrus TaxID=6339 RepID=A0A183GC33_HELPZ
ERASTATRKESIYIQLQTAFSSKWVGSTIYFVTTPYLYNVQIVDDFNINYSVAYFRGMEPVGAKNAAVSKTSMCIIAGYVIGKNRQIWSFCRCIVGMDHHCIWINQCVGAHNHRHFFLFIVYLTGATLTIILAGFNTLYDHVYMASSSMNFCSSALSLAPLQPFICSHEGLARTCVIFCYFISLLLFILVGFLTLWNSFLISSGYTYIDYLVSEYSSRGWRDFFNFRGLVGNWKNFFGVHRNRSFSRHILLPTTQPAIPYDDVDDGFDPMDIV